MNIMTSVLGCTNLDLYTANDDSHDECVLAIPNGLVKHTQVADVEINLSLL